MKTLAIVALLLAGCAARKPVAPPPQPSPCLHIDDGPCLRIIPHVEPHEEAPEGPGPSDPDEARTVKV